MGHQLRRDTRMYLLYYLRLLSSSHRKEAIPRKGIRYSRMYWAPIVTFEGNVRYPPKKEYFHVISNSIELEMMSPIYIYPR